MNYDHLAQLFEAARADGASTADALRIVDRERGMRRKLTPNDIAVMHMRRRGGELIKQLAFDFQLSVTYTQRLCSGVRRQKADPKPLPPIAAEVMVATAAHFELTTGELLARRFGPSRRVQTARRAAALVLRHAQLSYPLIARALGREDHTTAMQAISSAKADAGAVQAAAAIAAVVGVSMVGAPALERMAA